MTKDDHYAGDTVRPRMAVDGALIVSLQQVVEMLNDNVVMELDWLGVEDHAMLIRFIKAGKWPIEHEVSPYPKDDADSSSL